MVETSWKPTDPQTQPERGLLSLLPFVFLLGHELNGSTVPCASAMARPNYPVPEPMS